MLMAFGLISLTTTPAGAAGQTAPAAPTVIRVAPGNASITVEWAAPSSDGGSPITGYNLIAFNSSGVSIGHAFAASNSTSLLVNSSNMTAALVNGKKYKFGVQALNAIGPSAISKHSAYAMPIPYDADWSAISSQLAAVTEQANLARYFTPVGSPVVVSDGTSTGGIVAITGEANGAPTGTEQAVFFFRSDGTFLGTDSNFGKYQVVAMVGNIVGGSVTVTYLGTPKAQSTNVVYTWNTTAGSMSASATPPSDGNALQLLNTGSVPLSSLLPPNGSGGAVGAPSGASTGGSLPTPNSALNAPIVAMAPTPTGNGYWQVGADGGLFNFGDAAFHGSEGGSQLNAPIVGMAVDKATGGYWMVASDGGIFAFNAPFVGSEGGQPLNAPIVGMAAMPDGAGYWLVGSDGGIFAFGDAGFHGSEGGQQLNAPIVAMKASSDGAGYWLVGSDGGIFAFGNAGFHGSEGGQHLNAPIVGMDEDNATGGYWLVASDGGIFALGAPFYGSMGGKSLQKPMVAVASDVYEGGYWTTAADGGVFSFAAPFLGSVAGLAQPYPVPAPLNPHANQAGSCVQGSACSINIQWGIPPSPYLAITGFALSWAPPGGNETALGVVSGTSSQDSYSIQNVVPGTYTIYIQTVAGVYGSSVAVTVTIAPALGGGGGCGVTASGYVNPLCQISNLNAERIDQGVDYSGNGPIVAVGSGTVLSITNGGWTPGGAFIAYRLTTGRAAGLVVYAAEQIIPQVSVGNQVVAGQVLGIVYGGIETGWATASGTGQSLAGADGQWNGSSNSTADGVNFSQFLGYIGAPQGILYPPTQGAVNGTLQSW